MVFSFLMISLNFIIKEILRIITFFKVIIVLLYKKSLTVKKH